ncbi:HBS1-like protein isoform X3 [Phoenix dactylifera]|uniref:HBS1-like protein isoform X3 n=2 Tax=Phoenix dactylifera TaxID=42345 RepID=A0A8B8ZAG0_PHODC|nr:HBS1-like protein isoform X3 [Phoenix dactylifera]
MKKFGTDRLGRDMLRKLNYELDYDIYDEYDDASVGKLPLLDKPTGKPGFWHCSICTNNNDESLLSCDTCGVFRDSTGIIDNDSGEKVYGKSKDSRASVMARSLFALSPHQMPKPAVISDIFLAKEAVKSHEKGCIEAYFNDLQKTFTSPHCNHSINIAPFKFDTPSPDDIVSSGKNAARNFPKVPLGSTKASSNITGKKEIVNLLPVNEVSNSSSASSSKDNHIDVSESSNSRDYEDAPQIIADDLHRLKLDKNSKDNRSKKASRNVQYKPEKWMLSDQEQGISSQLNLAVVGHVDSGKSTLCGRLLHLLGRISKKQMHKNEKEAKEKGKGSFAYAWAMDESAEERQRGITMTVAVAYFDSKKFRVVLLDSPGHKDFVPNMISGATQADAAVLVVDASVGSFEAGMGGNSVGQTKEHAQLIRSFGVEQIIVAVNKMDLVEFSKERFDFIKLQLGLFLCSCKFKESSVAWIPLSAMENQNLVTTASDVRLSSWYQGFCLLDAIDSLKPPQRDVSKPLLLPICDVVISHFVGQVAVCGKLEFGALRASSKVLVMPSGDLATVQTIQRDYCPCTIAKAGDNVAVSLQGIDAGHVMPGGVLCHPDLPVTVASSLELKILVLDIVTPILVGSQVEIHIHHAKEAARVTKILSLLDQKSGKVSRNAPRILTARQSAIIEVALDGTVCVEEFSVCRALGRAFLRASGSTIAVGIVTRVLEQGS